MKALLFIFTISMTSFIFSQNIHFIKSYGNNGYDFGRDIRQDIDTGYIATGSSSSFTSANADAFLLKVDSLGDFKWSYNYGGSGSDWGEAVTPTSDSGYAIAGYTNSFGTGGFDFYFVKTAENGVPEFQKTYGGADWDKAYDMVQLPDEGFVLVGETFSFGAGNNDIYIIRINDLGDTLWTRTYGGPEADYANAVLLDGDSLVVVGGTESFGSGMSDGIIMKYHIDGTLGWVKTAGMEREDYFTSITTNNNGEYFLGGTRHYYYDQTGYLGDFWIYNMFDNGDLIADTSMTGGSHEIEVCYGIAVDNNDNIFYAGYTKSFGSTVANGSKDAFVGKLLNTYYQVDYIDNFGFIKDEVVYQFRNTSDKGFIAIGDTGYKSVGGNNLFILKLDKSNSFVSIEVSTELEEGHNITLSLNEISKDNKINIYPSLVNQNITISGIGEESYSIAIYDLKGSRVLAYENENLLDVNSLKSGFYILRIESETFSHSFKFNKI